MKRLVGVVLVMATVTALHGMDEVVSDECDRTTEVFRSLEAREGNPVGVFTCTRKSASKKRIPNDEHALFTLCAIRHKTSLEVTRYHHTGAFLIKYSHENTVAALKERLAEAGFRVEEEASFRHALIRRMADRASESASASLAAVEDAGAGDDLRGDDSGAVSTRTCAPDCNESGHGHNWSA